MESHTDHRVSQKHRYALFLWSFYAALPESLKSFWFSRSERCCVQRIPLPGRARLRKLFNWFQWSLCGPLQECLRESGLALVPAFLSIYEAPRPVFVRTGLCGDTARLLGLNWSDPDQWDRCKANWQNNNAPQPRLSGRCHSKPTPEFTRVRTAHDRKIKSGFWLIPSIFVSVRD